MSYINLLPLFEINSYRIKLGISKNNSSFCTGVHRHPEASRATDRKRGDDHEIAYLARNTTRRHPALSRNRRVV